MFEQINKCQVCECYFTKKLLRSDNCWKESIIKIRTLNLGHNASDKTYLLLKKLRNVSTGGVFMVTGSHEQYKDDFNSKEENAEISE